MYVWPWMDVGLPGGCLPVYSGCLSGGLLSGGCTWSSPRTCCSTLCRCSSSVGCRHHPVHPDKEPVLIPPTPIQRGPCKTWNGLVDLLCLSGNCGLICSDQVEFDQEASWSRQHGAWSDLKLSIQPTTNWATNPHHDETVLNITLNTLEEENKPKWQNSSLILRLPAHPTLKLIKLPFQMILNFNSHFSINQKSASL